MARGALISFEGIDGSGKSTQLARLVESLRTAGVDPLVVREPGGTQLGERLREVLLDPATGEIAPAAEALLYAASRAELVARVVEPALAAGRIVLFDRYVDSSLAYQGGGRELGIDRVLDANLLATGGMLPDVTLLVEVAPDEARRRRAEAGDDPDRLEAAGSEFFDRVAAAYDRIATLHGERIVRIDGGADPDRVEARVREAVAPTLAAVGVELVASPTREEQLR